MSCSRIYNDYDGVQHDYTRKQGLVWQQVFLQDMAPVEWADREILWNAVEEAEKTKDSRLAREFVVALPVELDRDEWITLLTNFIQTNFVANGMCADVCVHDTDGHNPHAHIMLTVRPLTKDGKWQKKNIYVFGMVKNGDSLRPSLSRRNPRVGRSNINIVLAKRRCICPPLRPKRKAMSASPNIPKAQNTADKIRLIVRISLFSGGQRGLM